MKLREVELGGDREAELTDNGILFKQRPHRGFWCHFAITWEDFEAILENSYYDETSCK